ncbi:signal peptidase I [Candidatus Dojkabacteria bacterium]|jgi:signal peptidase I|nr:signal peptidase I [Candidatus Dojkabacteria bacterium]
MYEVENEEPKTGKDKAINVLGSIGTFIYSFVETVVIALVIAVVLYLFIMTPHEVLGNSMHPTYKNGEYLMANKLTFRFGKPRRGDVIIFKYSDTQDFIKRIIGIPGDSVMVKDGRVYINGNQLNETNYLAETVYTSGGEYLAEGQTIAIGENEYFVLGDNRPHSSDSRTFGPITENQIKGKAWIVYLPISEFRIVTHEEYKTL